MLRLASKFECFWVKKSNPRLATTSIRFNSQLFVSRLSFYTSDHEFHRLFSPFGEVKQAKLVMDPKTGRTKGFGFVTFGDEAHAQNALNALNARIINGRLIFVEFADKAKDRWTICQLSGEEHE